MLWRIPALVNWRLAHDARLLSDTSDKRAQDGRLPWAEALTEVFGSHQMKSVAGIRPCGRVETVQRGLMQVAHVMMTAQTLNYRMPANSRKQDLPVNILILGVSGKLTVASPSILALTASTTISPGDFMIVRTWLSYRIQVAEKFEGIIITMPAWWLDWRPEPRGVMDYQTAVMAGAPLNPIFQVALNTLLSHSTNDVVGQAAVELFGDVLTYNLNLAYLLQSGQPISFGKGPMVMEYILSHFQDESLTPKQAAIDLHCSLSMIHKTCAKLDTSFNRTLIATRLSRASFQLWQDHKTISQIAFSCGFKDVSHFSRLFKKKYGLNSSEFKKQIRLVK